MASAAQTSASCNPYCSKNIARIPPERPIKSGRSRQNPEYCTTPGRAPDAQNEKGPETGPLTPSDPIGRKTGRLLGHYRTRAGRGEHHGDEAGAAEGTRAMDVIS